MNILVCDGRSRASLQIVRSLSKLGHDIFVGESFFCMSFLSNKIREKVFYPDPDEDSDSFFEFICDFVNKKNIDFLFPVRDSSSEVFSRRKSELPSGCDVCTSDWDKMSILNNKGNLMKLAKELKILHPKTVHLENSNNLLEEIKHINFPMIAKPVSSSGSRGIKLIKDENELEHFLNNKKIDFSKYIIQEFIPHGGAIGFYSLCSGGVVKCSNIHIRIREYPHTGGPSTLRRSGKNSLVENLSKKLLNKIEWDGISMVEFRINKRNNLPYLMEVNTRFWGSLAVDIHSGVDFPSNVIKLNRGVDFKNLEPKIVYVRWLFLGDILWLMTHPNKLRALKSFLNFKKQKFDILDISDPLPVIGSIIEGLISITKRKRRLHAFNRGWDG